MKKLIVANHSTSLIDVYGSVSFVLWLCGCNLKCPYCHNWEITLLHGCKPIDEDDIINEISRSEKLVEYVQATGGEPLLQVDELIELYMFVKENTCLKTSLNSNLVLYNAFKSLTRKVELNHVATDIKVPFEETTGVEGRVARSHWRNYVRSLSLAVDENVFVELRLPFFKGLELDNEEQRLTEVLNVIGRTNNYVIIVQPLLGEPYVKPRCSDWCRDRCNPKLEELLLAREWFVDRGFTKVYVRE